MAARKKVPLSLIFLILGLIALIVLGFLYPETVPIRLKPQDDGKKIEEAPENSPE